MGLENTINFLESAALIVGDKVVNDKAGDYPVKNRIRIREGRSESFIPLNIRTTGFIAGDIQHLRIAIQSCNFGFRMSALEHERQRACAAAEIKHFHLWMDVCLLDQSTLETLLTHNPFEQRIVKWRK